MEQLFRWAEPFAGTCRKKSLKEIQRHLTVPVLVKNHVEQKWRDYPIEQIKPLLVEDWLKRLNLAPKSKSHLKNLMRVLFNAAMRWELIPYQQPHEPRPRERQFGKTARTKGTFSGRVSKSA